MKRLCRVYFQIVPLALLLISCGGGGGGSAGPSDPPPDPPKGISATAGNQQVTVSWNSVTESTSYKVYYATSSGVSKSSAMAGSASGTSYAHTGRTNGTEYFYVVTANNSGGESIESAEVWETPVLNPPPAP